MDFSTQGSVKKLLEEQKIFPQKKFGQNFLINKGIVDKFMKAAGIKKEDRVIEIGPGTGILTQELAKTAKKVIAVEKDGQMVEILRKILEEFKNIEIIQQDIRKLQIENFKLKKYKVAANIPFYLTAPLIRKFLEDDNPPKDMTLIVQKEVSQRICAKVPDMNLLAASVQFYAEPKIIAYISKGSFWPQPKVDAAIIKITPREKPDINKSLFFKIVKTGFSQPRKQLLNNLSRGLKQEKLRIKDWLENNNIKPEQRAETLSTEEWVKLADSWAFYKSSLLIPEKTESPS